MNDAIVRPIKRSNTFDEVSHKLANATHYTGFDATQGFFHVPLSEKSKMLTAMLTPYGTYVFNFLPMGCSCSGDLFEACIHELFSDLIEQGRMTNIADDILCYGANEQEHDINVIKFLDRCVEVDMHLNPRKVKFKSPEVPFYGNMLTKDGIKPDPKKVDAIQDWPIPEDRQQLQSFLGSVNYLSHFIAGLSDLRKPLQNLVGTDTPFTWTETHTQAFNRLKGKISNDCLIHFYDTKKPVFIECDSSGVGIGAVLLQPDSNRVESDRNGIPCNLRPVAYASKSLTEAERRYANIERELLAVLFSVEHFKHFVYARDVTIITDHKPLLAVFKKCIHNMAPRLARMMLRLSDYNITMLYKAGKEMFLSDALSRLRTHDVNKGTTLPNIDVTIHEIDTHVSLSQMQNLQKITNEDPVSQLLKRYIADGWPSTADECQESVRKYFSFRDELCIVDGLILKGRRIVIPESHRPVSLAKLHTSHLGKTKTTLRARMCVFWPGISKDIATMIEKCEVCQKYQDKQPREQITSPPIPSSPWHTIASDLFEFRGKTYLIVSDRYSKFVIVRELPDHSTEHTIRAFRGIFSEHDIPCVLITDRGRNYTSSAFTAFCRELDISHILTSAYHHQSNPAERAIRTVKQIMRKCIETGNPWRLGLLEYLCTPISDQIPAPSELLNRRYRGVQPFLHFTPNHSTASFLPKEKIQDEQHKRQELNKFHYNKSSVAQRNEICEGSNVLVYITDQRPKRWCKGIVLHRKDKTYDIQLENGKVINRNRVDIRLSKLPFIPKPSLPMPKSKPSNARSNVPKVTQVHQNAPPPPSPPSPPKQEPSASTVNKMPPVTTTRAGRVVKPPTKMNL